MNFRPATTYGECRGRQSSGAGSNTRRPLVASVGMWALLLVLIPLDASANPVLPRFVEDLDAAELVPGADRLGPVQTDPPLARAYQGDRLVGYVFVNSDLADSSGYSGKPIHVAIGLDTGGTIVGVRLLEHHEPIVLIGIPEARVDGVIRSYVGRNALRSRGSNVQAPDVDVISGATVTVLVIDDSIRAAAYKVARSTVASSEQAAVPAEPAARSVDLSRTGTASWSELVQQGAVARLHLTVGEVNRAFAEQSEEAGRRPAAGEPGDTFIDLYAAVVNVPVIGRSLLGEREYQLLRERLAPGEQAILVGGQGPYSWRGSGYVRGGIFDRIELRQDAGTIRFRDRDYKRLGDLAAEGAPDLSEIGLFTVPAGTDLDPGKPWQLQLLVQRAIGALDKAFLSFSLDYRLPESYLEPEPAAPETATPADAAAEPSGPPLWLRIWQNRAIDIAVLSVALLFLGSIFLFQDWFAKRPRLAERVRIGFLFFTLVWLGWYANAQLSVVNVLTFSNALMSEFRWEFFLKDPLVFILWCVVAVSLLFLGRGVFCGWLCPFGALQEFISRGARLLRIPQVRLRWGLHERTWPIKYLLFVGLFGVSLHSLGMSERLSEVEPFKTAIILNFVRDWPFVFYAIAVLGAGLFIERFFCRYLCPLGAALAIPGRIRMFEWLKRHNECGKPCQRCRNECPVQAIHPEGHINPNECIYCLHCQLLYHDEHRCPVMIQRRLRRERHSALSTRTGSKKGEAKTVIATDATT